MFAGGVAKSIKLSAVVGRLFGSTNNQLSPALSKVDETTEKNDPAPTAKKSRKRSSKKRADKQESIAAALSSSTTKNRSRLLIKLNKSSKGTSSFYQAHWYIDPVMVLMGAVLASPCLEQNVFDLAYMTELDPLWNDDEMTMIINPDSLLFGNLVSKLACGADCVASTLGFGYTELFWCAGCQGPMYPLNGHVAAHVGGVQASSLIVSRLIAKMHREGLMWAASGSAGLCGYYPQILMDKANYKYQMHFPVAQNKILGRCCQPLGRSTILWGAGKEIPGVGEDFAYMIFRKRSCCQGAF